MPKNREDKSETVRIKSSFAEYIREESKDLNLNFLDTLYHIISVYRHAKYEATVRQIGLVKQEQKPEETEAITQSVKKSEQPNKAEEPNNTSEINYDEFA